MHNQILLYELEKGSHVEEHSGHDWYIKIAHVHSLCCCCYRRLIFAIM